MPTTPAAPRRENLLLNIVCNVAIPAIILAKFSTDRWFGPAWGLVIALAFPLGYGVYDFVVRRKTNFISILGIVSVLLSGGLGLLKLDGRWFAIKDAAVPAVIGLALLVSLRAKEPLVKALLYNDTIIDVPRVSAALAERRHESAFAALMRRCTMLVAASFFISAALNYFLARYLLRSPGGTPEFNAELAKMHLWSWPVIMLPSMAMMFVALWRLLRGLKQLTGLEIDQIFRDEKKPASSAG